jgi:hypothetical protein
MNIIERAKNILLQPKQEWQVIDVERTSVSELYTSYIMLLAAIGPLASIVGFSLIGVSMPFMGTVRLPLSSSVTQAVVSYVLGLVGVYILALIINALAPTFAGVKDSSQALKVAAYASTAAWLGGVFTLVPTAAVLGLLAALYSIYLLYLGLPVLMKSPPSKALGYTVTVFVAAIVIFIGIGVISSRLVTAPFSPGEQQAAKQLEEAVKGLQEALPQGGTDAGDAMKKMEEALTAGKRVEPVDFRQLKELLPESSPGLQRTTVGGERSSSFGINISKAEAQYTTAAGGTIQITISDMGNMSGITGLATYTWATADIDRETETGYERTLAYRGHKAYEQYDKESRGGKIHVVVAGRFLVEAEGNDVKIEEIRAVLDRIDLTKLAAVKT